uniref:Bm13062 n=1 Tax=Brugia malayi TaxID=6279 RepID=A0A0J9XRT7_BRUMA|nr:Bm13062 [Brugia malayi]
MDVREFFSLYGRYCIMKNFNTFGYFTKHCECTISIVGKQWRCYCLSTMVLQWDNMHLAVSLLVTKLSNLFHILSSSLILEAVLLQSY